MEKAQLVTRLAAFGLEEQAATAYFHLSRLGEAKAAEVAHATGRSRPDTYRTLEILVQAGFAHKSLERPIRFSPIPIDRALDAVVERRQQELRELDDVRPELERLWPTVMGGVDRSAQHFAVHQGLVQVLGVLGRMLDDATDEVTIATSPRLLQRLQPFTERLAARARGGLSVRILCPVGRVEDAAELQALSEACTIRHTDLSGNMHMFFADGRQMAFFVSAGRAASTQHLEETVLWLDAPDMVLAQEAVFDTLWSQGVALTERTEEVTDGQLARRVQVLRGRWVRINRMREMFDRARHAIRIAADPVEVARWGDVGLQQLLDAKRDDGLLVDVSVVPSTRMPAAAGRASHEALGHQAAAVGARGGLVEALRAPDVAAAVSGQDEDWTSTALVVVDDTEALEIFGSTQAPNVRTFSGEWSVWSSHPEAVLRACREFDLLAR